MDYELYNRIYHKEIYHDGGVMPEKTCPPHKLKIEVNNARRIVAECDCGYWITTEEIVRRLNEYERLAIGIDAFLSDATLLPVFSHAPEALSNFIIGWVKSFQAILSGGKDET